MGRFKSWSYFQFSVTQHLLFWIWPLPALDQHTAVSFIQTRTQADMNFFVGTEFCFIIKINKRTSVEIQSSSLPFSGSGQETLPYRCPVGHTTIHLFTSFFSYEHLWKKNGDFSMYYPILLKVRLMSVTLPGKNTKVKYIANRHPTTLPHSFEAKGLKMHCKEPTRFYLSDNISITYSQIRKPTTPQFHDWSKSGEVYFRNVWCLAVLYVKLMALSFREIKCKNSTERLFEKTRRSRSNEWSYRSF